jgi:hypothetical protein
MSVPDGINTVLLKISRYQSFAPLLKTNMFFQNKESHFFEFISGKGKANPIAGLEKPLWFQEFQMPGMSRESASRSGRLYPRRGIPGTNFC